VGLQPVVRFCPNFLDGHSASPEKQSTFGAHYKAFAAAISRNFCYNCPQQSTDSGKGRQMKLVTYARDKSVSCAILTDAGLIDVQAVWAGPNPPRSLKEILEIGPSCLNRLAELARSSDILTPLDSVKLLAPIPRPGKVIALAGNYSEHIKEAGLSLGLSDSPGKTTVPRPFLMPATVIIGPDREIPWPAYSEQIDYELELAVIIGKKAKCIKPDDALEYVAGYTIANDVSARSVTFARGRAKRPWDEFYDWLNGKWADGFLPMDHICLRAMMSQTSRTWI
jgi:2-keto-4-pentenoate hydratase/2-oxohepta-3-ene-1,7-dioic acid hydratase in catechol pathway